MTKKEKLETADMIAKLYGRIKELEAEVANLRQELIDERDYLNGIIKQTERDASREIDKYRP
jgi:predicted S18 family serine protease